MTILLLFTRYAFQNLYDFISYLEDILKNVYFCLYSESIIFLQNLFFCVAQNKVRIVIFG